MRSTRGVIVPSTADCSSATRSSCLGRARNITSFLRERITSVVYDAQGNAYFAGHNVYSLAPDGTYNWIAPLLGDDGEPVHARGRMVRDPRGDLYFSATDGHIYGVDGSDGTVRWRSLLTGGGQALPVVVGGIGEALLAYAPHSNWRGPVTTYTFMKRPR